MAGENEGTTETVETAPAATETVEAQPPVSTATETTEKPHPLQPGGVRFEEVYGNWKASQREAELLRQENERLRSQPPKTEQPKKVWSEAELQALVDQGRITPAQMSAQIALQVTEASERRIDQRIEQRAKADAAKAEVNAYLTKVPALTNTASAEFQRVAIEAQRIADDIGLPTTDVRVQRLALTAALGPLDRLVKAEQHRDFNRQHADTHAETGGGGGQRQQSNDPLKNVEPERIAHWQRLGYTREQMIAESKYIRRPLRATTR